MSSKRNIRRIDAIDWNDNKDYTKQISNEIGLDFDVSVAVSIQKLFSELGFNKKKGIELLKARCNLLENLSGKKIYDIFGEFVENKVMEILENGLNCTKSEKSDSESIINDWFIEMTKEILIEPEAEKVRGKEREIHEKALQTIRTVLEKQQKGMRIIEGVL